ncbi:MAG: YciI family protein [Propionibacterium sp.]|nr:YciI family protein [Propionibacterium sp.]
MAHLFIIDFTYTASLERIDEMLDEQRAWFDDGYAAGVLLASGRKVPRKGTIILAVGQSAAEIDRYFQGSPFVRNGLVEHRITEFVPSKTCDALTQYRTDK